MRLNLTITEKGLVLVSVPILFEAVFVCVLLFLLNQSDRIAFNEAQKRLVATEVNRIHALYYQEAGLIFAYNLSTKGAAGWIRHCELLDADIQHSISIIQNVQAPSPQAADAVRKFSAIAEKLTKQGRVCRELAIARETGTGRALQELFDIRDSLTRLIDASSELLDILAKDQSSSPEAVQRSRQLVSVAIMVALTGNVLIALYLAFFFSQGLAKRVDVIVQNTNIIAEGKTLNDPLSGEDEFATIDGFIHRMAKRLQEVDAQKHELLSMIGHDIRAPITAARLTLTLLSRNIYGTLPAKANVHIKRADDVLGSLERLTEDLMDLERLRSGTIKIHKDDVDYASICRLAFESVTPLAQAKNLKLTCELAECTGYADKERLAQVLNNLLSNAIKFSPDRRTVTLSLQKQERDVVISVKDEGPGIPLAVQEMIFERLYQTDIGRGHKSSAGLGLHICKNIVILHGGNIWVHSKEGSGATFFVSLPVSSQKS